MSHFQSNLGSSHCIAIKRELRYMKGKTDYMLCYGESDLRLHGYTNMDYAGDLGNHKLTFAYTFLLEGGAISWYSKKQLVMVL